MTAYPGLAQDVL